MVVVRTLQSQRLSARVDGIRARRRWKPSDDGPRGCWVVVRTGRKPSGTRAQTHRSSSGTETCRRMRDARRCAARFCPVGRVGGCVGPVGIGGRVHTRWVTKELRSWQKHSPNYNFLVLHSPSTLSTSKNIWRVGPAWGVRRTWFRWEKFSIVFAPYSIDTTLSWSRIYKSRETFPFV
jgi:hypothetical protein